MIRSLFAVALVLAFWSSNSLAAGPVVVLETSEGDVMLLLDDAKAPKTVANFLRYVDSGFYEGTIFHRVIKDFMIQGGGFDQRMLMKPAGPPIANEADNGLSNKRGTIAMARTMDPQSASSQFYINHKDNPFLDFTAKTNQGWGYAVFGRVIRGMDVVDRIASVKTGVRGGMQDVPVTAVILKRAYRRTE
ncbi:peptidylprolyl isomerase [Desulfocurvus sp. DL9XJH121]